VSSQASRFLLPEKKEYNAQYFNIYKCRINQLRNNFVVNLHTLLVKEGTPEVTVFSRIIDQHPGQEGIIIGHVMKDMAKKPCILDEYDKDFNSAHNDSFTTNYCSDDDSLALEDEHGKVSLVFPHNVSLYSAPTTSMSESTDSVYSLPVSPHMFVTGMVLGVQGVVNDIGELVVSRIFLPSMHAYASPSSSSAHIPVSDEASAAAADPVASQSTEESEYIAILSDVGLGGVCFVPSRWTRQLYGPENRVEDLSDYYRRK